MFAWYAAPAASLTHALIKVKHPDPAFSYLPALSLLCDSTEHAGQYVTGPRFSLLTLSFLLPGGQPSRAVSSTLSAAHQRIVSCSVPLYGISGIVLSTPILLLLMDRPLRNTAFGFRGSSSYHSFTIQEMGAENADQNCSHICINNK